MGFTNCPRFVNDYFIKVTHFANAGPSLHTSQTPIVIGIESVVLAMTDNKQTCLISVICIVHETATNLSVSFDFFYIPRNQFVCTDLTGNYTRHLIARRFPLIRFVICSRVARSLEKRLS